jgi:hypothetical protein
MRPSARPDTKMRRCMLPAGASCQTSLPPAPLSHQPSASVMVKATRRPAECASPLSGPALANTQSSTIESHAPCSCARCVGSAVALGLAAALSDWAAALSDWAASACCAADAGAMPTASHRSASRAQRQVGFTIRKATISLPRRLPEWSMQPTFALESTRDRRSCPACPSGEPRHLPPAASGAAPELFDAVSDARLPERFQPAAPARSAARAWPGAAR